MIYCKSWKDRSCEVGFAGEGDIEKIQREKERMEK